ncbi:MAG: ParA family protein [Patescibacteria group bacterium]
MVKIAVLNQKGGVGKTTSVINLASYLGKLGKQVTIVDFDPQGNATSGLGVDKEGLGSTIYDIVINGDSLTDALLETRFENIYLLPTNQQLAGAEVELASADDREQKLKEALKDHDTDFVLIDCPPSLGLLTINALVAADFVLIPVQSEYYALEGLSQLITVIQRVRESFNQDLKILGIVLTMADSRTSLADQVEAEVRKHFADLVFKTVIPRNVRLAEAPSHGRPISEHDRWSKGAKAYKNLTKEILSRVSS